MYVYAVNWPMTMIDVVSATARSLGEATTSRSGTAAWRFLGRQGRQQDDQRRDDEEPEGGDEQERNPPAQRHPDERAERDTEDGRERRYP